MPELPEVETLRRGLEKNILHRRIVDVVIANAKVLKGQAEAEFRARVIGRRIETIIRRGKYLLVSLTSGDQSNSSVPPILLCIHLKMRGQLLLESAFADAGPYHCVSLTLQDTASAERTSLRFYDMWTWGEMRALTDEELDRTVPALAGMGAEPLDPTWNADALAAKLAGRKGPIKPLLLDQSVVAGVGNIYADESLFRAGIRPERAGGSLNETEIERLTQTIRAVLGEAVDGGGTTSEDYVDVIGAPGQYTPQVYDRGGKPCVTCGTALTRIRLGGRGTVFCPTCQN